jgi:hypothetical protein
MLQEIKILYSRDNQGRLLKIQRLKSVKTPYCKWGNETLNGNIEWLKVLNQIIKVKKVTLENLSQSLAVKPIVLKKIIEGNDTSGLDFRTGAKLLALQDRL